MARLVACVTGKNTAGLSDPKSGLKLEHLLDRTHSSFASSCLKRAGRCRWTELSRADAVVAETTPILDIGVVDFVRSTGAEHSGARKPQEELRALPEGSCVSVGFPDLRGLGMRQTGRSVAFASPTSRTEEP